MPCSDSLEDSRAASTPSTAPEATPSSPVVQEPARSVDQRHVPQEADDTRVGVVRLAKDNMKFRLATVVWGERFTELFLRVTVRSLLGKGNIPELAAKYSTIYTIYTTEDSRASIEQSPLFQRLSDVVTVELVVFAPGEIDRKMSSSHWVAWRRAAALARENREIAFFIIPDMLYAAGTLARWAELFEQGFKAVWTSATQVVLETAIADIEARFSADILEPISISKEDVVRLAIRHLHPIIISMFRDSQRGSRHPEVVFCEVPGDGLAMRAIGSHPFCIDPSFFTMSDAFSPIDRFESIAFDESRGVGLEPLLKAPDLYFHIAPVNADRLSNMGSWLDFNCTPSDMLESTHTYRFNVTASGNDAAFRRADAALAFYACQVRITGGIYRAISAMRQAGCGLAAAFAATAHYRGRLRRHWKIRGPVTVLVPEDAGIESFGSGNLDHLLDRGNEKALLETVMRHILPGRVRLAPDEEIRFSITLPVEDKAGPSLRVDTTAKIVSEPIEIDDCTIYVITRPLVPRRVDHGGRSAILPNRWSLHPGRVFDSSPSQPSKSATLARIRATLRWPSLPRRIDVLLRKSLHLAFLVIAAIPGARKPADGLKRALIAGVRNSRALIRQRRARVQQVETKEKRKLVAQIAVAQQPPVGATNPSDSAHGSLGNAATTGDGAHRVDSSATRSAGTVSTALIEKFGDAQSARVVLVVAEVLRFYRAKTLEFTADYPPLHLVETCIREARLVEDKIVDVLREILNVAPGFAEAWYELGDIYVKRGDYGNAIPCFDHCLRSQFSIAIPPGRTGYDELAAFAKASALEAWGCDEAAAETYRKALDFRPSAGLMRVRHANLLQKLGRLREAAFEFDAGMGSDGTALVLPAMSPDFSNVARRLAELFDEPNAKSLRGL